MIQGCFVLVWFFVFFSPNFIHWSSKQGLLLKWIASGSWVFFLTWNTLLAVAINRVFVQIPYHNAWHTVAILQWFLYSPCHLFGKKRVMWDREQEIIMLVWLSFLLFIHDLLSTFDFDKSYPFLKIFSISKFPLRCQV